jgi:formylglycine-generating enzyme required for sulfatase activity
VLGFEDFESGSGGSAGSGAAGGVGGAGGGGVGGASGSSGSAGSTPCTDPNAPAGMIGVRISSGNCIWIDPHEVTNDDYGQFIAQFSDPAAFITTPCAFKSVKDDFEPGCATDGAVPVVDPGDPVTCVDWCDARAYCLYHGKVLCGDPATPNVSWWEDVCSDNDTHNYGYVGQYNKDTCNGGENVSHGCLGGPCELVAPGSSPGCVTVSGVYDMSGNAAEWTAECNGNTNENDTCKVRGGSVADGASALQCSTATAPQRGTRAQHRGFRCCWHPS